MPAASFTGTPPPGILQQLKSYAQELESYVRGTTITPFVGSGWEATAQAAYGSSIDLSAVFLSNRTGYGNRAFTIAIGARVPGVNPMPVIQIVNVGPSPRSETITHELAHVWQSQHASAPLQFMANSVASQKMAAAANGDEEGPFSAYGYLPNKSFGEYAAEQIARQAELGVEAIRSHMRSFAQWDVDPDNDTSLSTPRIEDIRNSAVQGVTRNFCPVD